MSDRYSFEAQIYKDAVMVQNACNLTAIARSLGDVMSFLRKKGLDERESRRHPVVCAFMFKMADMMDLSLGGSEYLYDKYKECETWLRENGEGEWLARQN